MAEQLFFMTVKNPRDYLYAVRYRDLVRGGNQIIRNVTRIFPVQLLMGDGAGSSRYGQGIAGFWAGQPDAAKSESPDWRILLLGGQVAIVFKTVELAQQFRIDLLARATKLSERADLFTAVIVERAANETIEAWWKRARAEAVHCYETVPAQSNGMPVTPFTTICDGCGAMTANDLDGRGLPIDGSCSARLRMVDSQGLLDRNPKPAGAPGASKESTVEVQSSIPESVPAHDETYSVVRIDLTPNAIDLTKDLAVLSAFIYQRTAALSAAVEEAFTKLMIERDSNRMIVIVDPLEGITLIVPSAYACPLLLEIANGFKWEGKAQLCAGIAVSASNIPYNLAVRRAESLLASARVKCQELPFAGISDGFVQFHRYRDESVVYDVDILRAEERVRFGVTTTGFPIRVNQLKSLLNIVKELRDLGLSQAIVELLLDAVHRERSEAIAHTKEILRHISGDVENWLNNHAAKYSVFPWKRKGKDEWWTDMADILELYSLGSVRSN